MWGMAVEVFVAAMAFAAACGPPEQPGALVRAIVNGMPAPPGAYPEVVALLRLENGSSRPLCSGTLIAPAAVLSAAHCVVDDRTGQTLRWSDVGVYIGNDATAV